MEDKLLAMMSKLRKIAKKDQMILLYCPYKGHLRYFQSLRLLDFKRKLDIRKFQ